MNKKYKVLALYGKGGAGKDTILNWIVSNYPYMHEIISCTTRPPRSYEKEGVNYFFLTKDEFIEKHQSGNMLETAEFNGWYYGTPLSSLKEDKINIGVFNPDGIMQLLADARLDVLSIEIIAKDKLRIYRMLERDRNADCQEVCRRFLEDEKDFYNLYFRDITFNNSSDRDEFHTIFNLPGAEEWIAAGRKELNI